MGESIPRTMIWFEDSLNYFMTLSVTQQISLLEAFQQEVLTMCTDHLRSQLEQLQDKLQEATHDHN